LAAIIAVGISERSAASALGDPLATSNPLGPTEVAITVDDIPEHGDLAPGMTRMGIVKGMIEIFKSNGIDHVYGFSNGKFMKYNPEEIAILKEWLAAGYPLGNHTYDHPNLNAVKTGTYLTNIAKQDRLLKTLDDTSAPALQRRMFRYPYLDEGDTLKKRNAVRTYLASNHYRVAEVTADYYDWAWTDAYTRCLGQDDKPSAAWLRNHVVEAADHQLRSSNAISELLFGKRIPLILLIHDGAFDVVTLDAILKQWRKQGVEFISLDQALADPAYQINPNLAYKDGLNFLEQIAQSRHVEIAKLEESVYTIDRLNEVCEATKSN